MILHQQQLWLSFHSLYMATRWYVENVVPPTSGNLI